MPAVDLRLDAHRRADDRGGSPRRRGRPARAHPRAVARRHRPRQRAPRPRRRPARAVGPGALRRQPRPGPARARRSATCSASATSSASSAATATSPRGWPPATTPPRSACSPSSTGACPPAPTCAPGPGRDAQLDAAEARLADGRPHGRRRSSPTPAAPTASRSSSPPTPRWPPPSTRSAATSKELDDLLTPWALAVMDAGGYPQSPLAITAVARPQNSGSSHQGHDGEGGRRGPGR